MKYYANKVKGVTWNQDDDINMCCGNRATVILAHWHAPAQIETWHIVDHCSTWPRPRLARCCLNSSFQADGRAEKKNLLGGKGANLAEMASIGLPVPPGFTLTTEICTYFYQNDCTYPKELTQQATAFKILSLFHWLTQTGWLQHEGWPDFLPYALRTANVRMSCLESCTADIHWSCLGLLPAGGRGSSVGWETHWPRVWWWYQPTSRVCMLWCPCIYARTQDT